MKPTYEELASAVRELARWNGTADYLLDDDEQEAVYAAGKNAEALIARLDEDTEPTSAQLEAMNNPDSGPSDAHYRDSMRDSGRGGLLR